ncbi:MAG TPA: bacillithiol biosynthesis deacetylase BshB1 [candidate division Zixibacteria bacterium]|nr:bacillithiol biosynthesis deacetylase BshB1 [candidate division Zixibacteria bacterium]MDD4918071.1 bacillithiol biosynthesis deacetylase BshB1 [candidate division Zixibacteria bacterium]MDM7973318.1 bacillithiol biosynthesis deacetylase BshB1 [candidate division Zixibacteria bacterium]HOZ08012.1 bacillithiol biosynthesis deacetylase BshB1 [candidate division Zixibacteria bacterium]HPM37411.1 bacillithiol biosynthesis deacetylase BshB1 [candidate division Zixibacteria bacterium]
MAEAGRLEVLAIAAHPDDAEITCGGTLLKLAALGRATGVLDLARGEAGTYGTEADRDAEASAAGRVLGLAWRENAGMPDAAIEYTQANKLVIAQYIRDHRPELVILPHWEQRHPDHLAASRLGYDACFLAGLTKIDLAGKPHRPRKIIYASYFRNREFSFLVDISAHFEKKCEAVGAYRSQFSDNNIARNIFHPGVTVFDLMRDRGANLGHMAGVRYAEAFTIKEAILVDDPQTMPVRSI